MPSSLNIHGDLIEKCRSQDRVAQHEIYKLYAKAMLNTAYRITGNDEDAEDVLQDSFVSAFRNIGSYREEAAFGAWLKRIVINKAITINRRNSQRLSVLESSLGQEPVDQKDFQEEDIHYEVELVRKGMMELPDGFRHVLTLYLIEGYDHKEIAQILGIAESTSKTQYKRAKEKLRMKLKDQVKYG